MADIPIISITREDTIEDGAEDEKYNIKDALTDVEDLDSDDNLHRSKSPISKLKLRRKNCKQISNTATDIEDYNDSDSDYEKNNDNQYETVISLNEFLDHGYVEEANSTSKTNRRDYSQCVEHKMKQLQLDIQEDIGGVTDCENVETSGDECDAVVATPAKYENFLVENEDGKTICIQNSLTKNEVVDAKGTSDSEVEQPSERKFRQKKNIKTRNVFVYDVSDVENILFSDDDESCSRNTTKKSPIEFDAEEIELESSDNEDIKESRTYQFPQFDISFAENKSTADLKNRKQKSHNIKPSTSKCMLTVSANDDYDGCTDIENLNSSDDDDETIAKNQLYIPTVFVKSDQLPLTDVEDFGSEDEESLTENVKFDIKMPSPVREITLTKENATGARMSKVMPMNGNLFLGIDESYIDQGMTDTEEMSGKEEDYCDTRKYAIETLPTIDGGFVSNSEYLLPSEGKKLETKCESVTDTEDININRGGVRRRKTKSRNTSKKSRNYLEPKESANPSVTDTEDIDMDDDHCKKRHVSSAFIQLIPPSNDGGITDVESLSGDEDELDIGMRTNELDSAALSQESFFSTVTSRDLSSSENVKFQTVEIPIIRKMSPMADKSCFTCTDTEEMQIVSDSDDQYLEMPSRVESVTPELHTILGESGKSTIHHKNMNRFDMCNEKHYIKGHKEYQDVVTDVEYLDDDGNAQKDACNNESKNFNFCCF